MLLGEHPIGLDDKNRLFVPARYRDELGVPVMMGVGGTFDHIAGVKRRAPVWLQRLNLEWLFRLITQPGRWRRQLTIPQFVWRVLRSRTRRGTP